MFLYGSLFSLLYFNSIFINVNKEISRWWLLEFEGGGHQKWRSKVYDDSHYKWRLGLRALEVEDGDWATIIIESCLSTVVECCDQCWLTGDS